MFRIIERLRAKFALDERDARAFHCDIGAGAHRDADGRGGERGRVIDAVTSHCHNLTLLAQWPDVLVVLGEDA